jgi:putative mRNA 3-end processing factor
METRSWANVTANGAVLLGKHVSCDAHEKTRPLRVVTHAHADHMNGLHQSLKQCDTVVMTPATKDLIDALKGRHFLRKGNVKAIEYDRPLTYDDEQLTLHKADHILGSAQVLVEDPEGTRILYTSDFRLEHTPVIESDIMVIEATYGSPWHTRKFGSEVRSKLVSIVEEGLRRGPVYVFGYHGKLQEVMQILHEAGLKTPFLMPERIRQLSKIHQKHGVRICRPLFLTKQSVQSTLQRDTQYVAFYHMNRWKKIAEDKFRVRVSGWEFHSPCRRTGENDYVVALSDHSDCHGLLEYVRRSKPKLVITDNYRAGNAEALAKQITKRLGIDARPLPK